MSRQHKQRSQRMSTVLQLAEHEQQQKATELAAAQAAVQKEKERLQHLEQIQHEYEQGMRVHTGESLPVYQLQNSMNMIVQITNLIVAQQRHIQMLELQAQNVRKELEQCWMRCKNLEKLQQRYEDDYRTVTDKKEQKRLEGDALARFAREQGGL